MQNSKNAVDMSFMKIKQLNKDIPQYRASSSSQANKPLNQPNRQDDAALNYY